MFLNLKKIYIFYFQPEWARPPSTPSSDGKPIPTTKPPGQWVPDSQTSPKPKPKPTTTTTSRPAQPKPTEKPDVPEESHEEDEISNEVECSGMDFMPHKDCDKYYRCNHGKKVEFQCKGGLVYHTQSHICDWPTNSDRDECRK